MNWATPDSIRITHPTGYRALVEVRRSYRGWMKAKALAYQMLRSKLWAAPGGPRDVPTGEVQVCDLIDHGQAYWSDGASIDAVDKRLAAELGERLEAEMSRRRADLDRRIFLPAPTENLG
jgi:hypothetical protein